MATDRRPPRALPLLVLLLLTAIGGPWPAVAQVSTSTQTRGPVHLGDGPGRAVSVVATYDEDTAMPREDGRRTLVRLAFVDGQGRLLYRETLESRLVAGQGFEAEVTLATAQEVRGTSVRLLLLALHHEPSAPSGGDVLVVYGFDRTGRFGRLGAPMRETGIRVTNPTADGGAVILLRDGRFLDTAEWTGNVTLVLPRRFDETHQALELASLCGRVEAEPRAPTAGRVALHRTYGSDPIDLRYLRPALTVDVRPASRIEVLGGCRRYDQARPGEYVVWLRVRIDGQEGWVSDEQALHVLGLPTAG